MTKADVIVRELLDALDLIDRAAADDKEPYPVPYIQGVVQGARARAKSQMERNSDGYLVVKNGAFDVHPR